MKRVVVISLGGSLILSKEGPAFLLSLRNILKKNYRKNKFVIVCGGGSIARQYIEILKKEGKSEKEQSLAGIRATRMNAHLVMQVFGNDANNVLPMNMKQVKQNLGKNHVVICGSLRYAPRETSDSTSADLAHYLKAPLINITNVNGLFTADPKKSKKAKLIKSISWKNFAKLANRIHYKPGQHFVLDQHASILIKKYKIPTYITGSSTNNINKLLNNKKFTGTIIN